MTNVKNQKWLPGAWVCGNRVMLLSHSELGAVYEMDCIGNQIKLPSSPSEIRAVCDTDSIIIRLALVDFKDQNKRITWSQAIPDREKTLNRQHRTATELNEHPARKEGDPKELGML